jgi:hypothetical protein
MPGGVLVIGVGGTGRGVVNHLKKRLINLYGSPASKGITLYVVDGPERDSKSECPGEFQIDVSPASQEKYRFVTNPTGALTDLSTGQLYPYISPWLSQDGAVRTPKVGIEPNNGFGGVRVPGRIALIQEANQLKTTIKRLLTRMQEQRTLAFCQIFIVGSQTGGTGAGLLTDIVHMVRTEMENPGDRLTLILSLPDVYIDFMEGDNRARGVANGIAGLREILRSMAVDAIRPFRTQYNDIFKIQNPKRSDFCYLVNGGARYRGNDPREWLYPSCADMILAHIQGDADIFPELPNRASLIDMIREHSGKFSRYGIHEIIFPANDIIDDFSYRFSHKVLELLTAGSQGQDGKEKGLQFIHSMQFTTMAAMVGQNPAPPLKPEQCSLLGLRFTVPGSSGGINPPPLPDLKKTVGTAGLIFDQHKTNIWVMKTTEQQCENHLGINANLQSKMTVRSWLESQTQLISREFQNLLFMQLRNIFYDKDADGNLYPKAWYGAPGMMRDAAAFATLISEYLERLKGEFERAAREYGQVGTPGKQIKLSQLKRNDMDSILAKNPHEKDKALQEKYLKSANEYLIAKVWELYIEYSINLVSSLKSISDSILVQVGAQANGWLNTLNSDATDSLEKSQEATCLRAEFSKIKTRTYFPTPGGDGDQNIYSHVVHDLFFDSYLRQCSWTLKFDKGAGDSPDSADQLRIIANIPPALGFRNEYEQKRLKDFLSSKVEVINIKIFNWREISEYIRHQIEPQVRNLTLWDAMAYELEFDYGTKIDQQGRPFQEQLRSFISEHIDKLISHGQDYQLNCTAVGLQGQSEYCVSSFKNIAAAARLSNADHIAGAVLDELNQKTVKPITDSSRRHQLIFLKLDDGIDLDNWSYLSDGRVQYYDYQKRANLPPISIFPNEKNAVEVEMDIAKKSGVAEAWTDIKILHYLEKIDVLRVVGMSYLFGILQKCQSNWGGVTAAPVDSFSVRIKTQTGYISRDLAPEWQWSVLLDKFMFDQSSPENFENLKNDWENYLHNNLLVQHKKGLSLISFVKPMIDNLKIADVPPAYANRLDDKLDHGKLIIVLQSILASYLNEINS